MKTTNIDRDDDENELFLRYTLLYKIRPTPDKTFYVDE